MRNPTVWIVFVAVCLIAPGIAVADVPDEGDDPDLPAGVTDQADYIARRDAFVALLRGNDPARPIDPTARVRANALMENQRAALRTRLGPNSPLVGSPWVELGPNPIPNGQTQTVSSAVSGRIAAIEIDPADPNKVYVGAAQGGVYRSLDGGATWTPIFDDAQTLAIGALALDPATGSLWVGTGEANGSADSFAGVGLYRIDNVNTSADLVGPINPIRNYTDSGNTPRSTGFFTGRSISKIVIAPGNQLFAGVAGGVIGFGNTPFGNSVPPLAMRGLVRLANVNGPVAGITGTRLAVSTTDTGLGLCFDTPCTVNRNVNDLVLDPLDVTGNTLIVWLNGINIAGDGGIYRSTNALGATPTFTQTFVTPSTSTSNGRGALATFARAGITTVYAASGEPSTGGSLCNSAANAGGLRRSVDGGVTWSSELPGGGGFCSGQCFYNVALDVVAGAATATDKILLGGNVRSTNCAKLQGTSLDGAATVFANTDVGLHADSHVIKVAPSNALVVYRGDDGGVWKSVDGGATWSSQNNATMRATQFQSIAVHPTDPDFTIGGTQDNGTEKLTTGPTWIRVQAGDGGFAMIDQNATDTTSVTMYHTYYNQLNSQIGYEISTNAGASWSYLGCSGTGTTNGVACSSATTTAVNFYAPTALGPGNPNTVYLGTDRLLRSSTSGTANATVSQAPLVSGVALSSIAISPQDDNYRIVGLNNGALFFTTTGSSTLTTLDPTGGGSVIPDFYVGRLAFDPANKNTVYIALGNYAGGTSAAQSHLWKVTNLNTTPVITAANGSGDFVMPDVPVNGLVVDPADTTNVYAGTDIGVFISQDRGATWAPFGEGLPRVAVFDMAVQPVKHVLRIATHGRGMWEIGLASSQPQSDLSITKSDGVATVNGGSATTYTVRVTNNGPASVTGAILSDPAAPGLSKTGIVCSATPGQCVSAPSVGQIEGGAFALPALASGQFYEISVTADVTVESGSVANTAAVEPPAGTNDPVPVGNSASDIDSVNPGADLTITNNDAASGVNAGGTTTYKVRVTNNGPSSVTGAILSDPPATGLGKTTVACSATPGKCVSAPSAAQLEGGLFALPALTAGQFYEISVTVNVTATSGSVTNTASVAAPAGTPDGKPANNSAGDTDSVTPVADLAVTKNDGVSAVSSATTTTYKIRVTNNGPSSVAGAILSDPAASGLSKTTVVCSATPGQCMSAPSAAQLQSGTFALPALASGQFYELSVAANVTATTGSVTNSASASVPAGTIDPDNGNNSASDSDTLLLGNLSIAPATLDFGNQPEGTTSGDDVVTLGNDGAGTLTVSQITLAAAPFNRTASGSCGNSLPFNIAANDNCTLSYSFSPPTYGPSSQPFTVTATGTGANGFTLKGNGTDIIFANGFQ